MMQLRAYQNAALDAARYLFASGRRSILLVAPTGAGKTVMFCAMAQRHADRGGRVLVVVHRRELIKQTVAKMRAGGIERIGIVAADLDCDPEAPVLVASIQTLLTRGVLPDATLVIFDESHHMLSAQWNRVAQHYAKAKIVGVTATPERSDGAPMGDLFEAIVPVSSVRELTRLGYLAPCDVIAPPRPTKKLSEDPVAAYERHAAGRKAIVFASTVEDAHALARRFSDAGHPAAAVEGETATDAREETLARFAVGDVRVLCNVYVLTEGFDEPSCEVCLLARGCRSTGAFLQMVGRVLRPSPGKVSALLIDLRGSVHMHGLPDEDRVYALGGRAISGGEAPLRTCSSCEHACPAGCRTCPHCGEGFADERSVVERVGMIRVSKADRERGFFLEQLDIARRRGFKPGWVAHRFVEEFGRFPAKLWRELVKEAA